MAKSKLALQFQNFEPCKQWAEKYVNTEYVKIIDPPHTDPFNGRVKVIGRVYVPDDLCNALVMEGAAGADKLYNMIAPTILARPYVWAWEWLNEPHPLSNYRFCEKLVEFNKRGAELLHKIGRKIILGNISEGSPGSDSDIERAKLATKVAESLQYGDFWGYHGYFVPTRVANGHKESGYTKWHARGDKQITEAASKANIKLPPLFITELGIDGGIVGKPKVGYKGFDISFTDYLKNDLLLFDADYSDEDNIIAGFIFVAGANGDWTSFEVGENEAKELDEYIKRKNNEAPVVTNPKPEIPNMEQIIYSPYELSRPLRDGIGRVSQGWGVNAEKYKKFKGLTNGHNGYDYAVPEGTEILVMHDGVAYTGYDEGGFGNFVKVINSEMYTIYAHLKAYNVKDGQTVRRGDVIGFSGNTGNSTGPHLHVGWKVIGVSNPGYLDYQNPLLGRYAYDKARLKQKAAATRSFSIEADDDTLFSLMQELQIYG